MSLLREHLHYPSIFLIPRLLPLHYIALHHTRISPAAMLAAPPARLQNYPAPLATDLALFIKDTATPPYAIG